MPVSLLVLVLILAVVVSFAMGWWFGMRTTARNADRLLAVMTDNEIVTVARKARARRELLGSAGEPADQPRPEPPTRPSPGRPGG